MQDLKSQHEDFYIDDDFYHGIGANMELVSDSSEFLDTIDLDVVSMALNSKNDKSIGTDD